MVSDVWTQKSHTTEWVLGIAILIFTICTWGSVILGLPFPR